MISKAHAQRSESVAMSRVSRYCLNAIGKYSNLGKCLECRLRGITVEIDLQLIN